MSTSTLPPFVTVGTDKVRHLRDGAEAFPAMLAAIEQAKHEVLLEMYWITADRIGERFRHALVAAAGRGVRVCVLYDSFGSLTLPSSFWTPLQVCGGRAIEFNPISPISSRFRITGITFRDHRKLLVVDGHIGFTGGINLALQWASPEDGGDNWRDDAIEVRGPATQELRALFFRTWSKTGGLSPGDAHASFIKNPRPKRVWVIADRFNVHPDRSIRRAYIWAIRRARRSVDIASAYFLPGPLLFRAIRQACKRGVRVRILIPEQSDVWIVAQTTNSMIRRMLARGVQVYAYRPRVLHTKTAIIDDRLVTIGSHNLDAISRNFSLECNLAVDDPTFAKTVRASFERDLEESNLMDTRDIDKRTWPQRVAGRVGEVFRKIL